MRLRERRGQSSVEYMLLLCMGVTVAVIVGSFLKKYVPGLLDRVLDKITDVALSMAAP